MAPKQLELRRGFMVSQLVIVVMVVVWRRCFLRLWHIHDHHEGGGGIGRRRLVSDGMRGMSCMMMILFFLLLLLWE